MVFLSSPFITYLQLGWRHITDLNGIDHILFLIALCAVYRIRDFKQVAILATAFTIGHSLTLALSALDIIRPPADLIEFLIPVTIFLTAMYNAIRKEVHYKPKKVGLDYIMAALFGLIHGMGFSSFFRGILGQEASIVQPLLAFNVGLELGQLIIVAVILVMSYFFTSILSVKHRSWNLFISGAAAGMAVLMMMEKKFW